MFIKGDSVKYLHERNGEEYPAIITSVGPGNKVGVVVFIDDAIVRDGKVYGSTPPPTPPGGPGGDGSHGGGG